MASPLTERHRTQQLALRAVTLRELQQLWPALKVDDLDSTFPGWAAAVARLIRANHRISAALAARYLRQIRAAVVAGDPPLPDASAPSLEQIAVSLTSTTVAPIKKATARGVPLAKAATDAFVMSSGAATRLVMAGGRDTVQGSVAADEYADGWRRVTSGRACGFCRMLAGRGAIYRESSAHFASHDHCVVPGTMVTSPSVEAAYRRAYEGELIIIGLADGDELSITPNHPVLTNRGWVEAGLLRESDQVAQRAGANLASLQVPHEHDVPARIQDVWGSHSVHGLAAVPVTAQDFHGDGVPGQGDIEVVAPDGFLPDVFNTGFGQARSQPVGAGAGSSSVAAALLAESDPSGVLLAERLTSDGRVSRRHFREAMFGGRLCEMHRRRVLHGSPGHAGFGEPSLDDVAGDAVLLGESLLGLPGDVPPDDIFRGGQPVVSAGPRARFDPPALEGHTEGFAVHADLGRSLLERLAGGIELRRVRELRRVEYSGHVFNLRTAEGWYAAAGVIVSNCGCSAEPVYDPAGGRPVGEFTPSTRRLSDETRAANNARAREFIHVNALGDS